MIADLEARARDLAERSRALRDRIARAHATQRSPDGVVTATVAPNGSLRHIEFSPAAEGCSPARLGEVVMDTVRRAQEQAARQAVAVVEPQFGGAAAMGFLVGSVPASVEGAKAEAVPEGDDLPLPRSLRAPDDEPGSAPS
ncbi:YbaB/EbfC DNA-binding family protein [Saccharothrix carnea]|uniref:YbaB/EbfC DNA-binding family protein n=2 Tax=Saccharothrix carnea TaxID=1280637 RepID=A0A2P8IJI1_SACCR|nr:YbaB/EbfC DNA-binding family protein [Saccharothrix carnea]